MWLFTPEGFFSIVEDMDAPGRLMVRSRTRQDLERLTRLLKETTALSECPFEIEATPDRDYAWRFRCSKDEWSYALAFLGKAIDYSNFKDEVYRVLGEEREAVLHDIWARLLRAFRPFERSWAS